MDEGIQSMNVEEADDVASGPYENQSPQKLKIPVIDVNIAASNTNRSN